MTYLIFGNKGYVASNIINYLEKEQEELIKLSANSDYSNNSLNILLKKISSEALPPRAAHISSFSC